MSDNIAEFPSQHRSSPVNHILAKAAGKGATDIVVIGWDRNGELFLMSSNDDAAEVVYLMEQAKLEVLAAGRPE